MSRVSENGDNKMDIWRCVADIITKSVELRNHWSIESLADVVVC